MRPRSKIMLFGMSVSIVLICIFSLLNNATSIPVTEDSLEQNNDSKATATVIAVGSYNGLSQGDDDWYLLTITKQADVDVTVYCNITENPITLALYNSTAIVNSSANTQGVKQHCSVSIPINTTLYVLISGANNNASYDLIITALIYGDNSGFTIGDQYLTQGYTPHTFLLVISYLAMGFALALYIQMSGSFLSRASKTENKSQRSYFRGLGAFMFSVAISEFLYVFDLLYRDVYEERIFLQSSEYPIPFESLFKPDYFVVDIVMVLFALAVLMYPLEKYLYGKEKANITTILSLCIPLPIVIRFIEINHSSLGLDLSDTHSVGYQIMTGCWIAIALVGVVGLLNLIRVYIDLGRKAPEGSKLRRKSQQIIIGLILWISAIFTTSRFMKDVSDVTSDYAGAIYYFLFPFIIPAFLTISVALLASGFNRDY